MPITAPTNIIKTVGKLNDDLTILLSKSRDWSKIRRGEKINITLSDPQYLELFKIHGKRSYAIIDDCVTNAILKFYLHRISNNLISTDPQKLKKEYETITTAPKTRETLVLQLETKMLISGKLDWVIKYFTNVLDVINLSPEFITSIPISDINATHIDQLVYFDAHIDGQETQQAIIDRYLTTQSNIINCEIYNEEQHGKIKDTFYEDFQYYWLREPIKEFSKKKSLRKIPGQSFGKFVGKFETSDKVKILGIYKIANTKVEKNKNISSPAEDVEIEIINMERLDDDVEIILTKQEIQEFKKYTREKPDEFIKDFVESCSPHIEGNITSKLAIILSEIGPTDLLIKYRPHIHLYLTGNPGTAKSEMLKWFARVSYMGVYADAPNASSRGLMYGQEEHGKRKILKAGLMVRNKKLFLDELDKMGDTRQELNTAMEQQIASYHKNPFDIDTDIDCTVIAAGNPVFGKWKDGIDILEQLKPIKPELLSRFLILRVIKTGTTRKLLTHVFDTMQDRIKIKPKYSEREIAGLLNYCRKLNPPMSQQAENAIIDFAELFEGIKQDAESNLDFEARSQINVIRVSSAFAKFLQKDIIDEDCAKYAIKFINECNRSLGMITDIPIMQGTLLESSVNKDELFFTIIKQLQQESEDGCFLESELVPKMIEYTQHWQTEDSAAGYWRRHNPNYNPKSEYYEPHVGRFKKV